MPRQKCGLTKRSANWSKKEIDTLLNEVTRYRKFLLPHHNGDVPLTTRRQCWDKLSSKVNSVTLGVSPPRSVEQICQKWHDIKSHAKKKERYFAKSLERKNSETLPSKIKPLTDVDCKIIKILSLAEESDLLPMQTNSAEESFDVVEIKYEENEMQDNMYVSQNIPVDDQQNSQMQEESMSYSPTVPSSDSNLLFQNQLLSELQKIRQKQEEMTNGQNELLKIFNEMKDLWKGQNGIVKLPAELHEMNKSQEAIAKSQKEMVDIAKEWLNLQKQGKSNG